MKTTHKNPFSLIRSASLARLRGVQTSQDAAVPALSLKPRSGILFRISIFRFIPLLSVVLLLPAFSALAQNSQPCTDQSSPDCSNNSSSQYGDTVNPTQNGAVVPDNSQTLQPQRQSQQQNNQLYVDSAGNTRNRQSSNQNRQNNFFPPDRPTDMQRLTQASTGEQLTIFGRDLFQRAPSTFAPVDQIPAMSDYVVGPGDELLLRLWGPESFNGQLTVDSSGSIYVPQVGGIHVAGLRIDQLQSQISSDIRHTFRNFNLSVDLGHLRSIQVYVVGEARRPGVYTVSSLSTVLNVLFVAGGPNVQGSLRHIEVRRDGKVAGELDLYDLLLKGDKTHDLRLQPNDTIFIPPVGPQAALAGSVHHPAIYELRNETTIGDLLNLAGGLTPTGSTTQLSLERVDIHDHSRTAVTVNIDDAGRAMPLRDGDVLFVNHITSAYQQSVTIRGNLANPGRFPWHPGMRLSDIIPDRKSLLTNNYWRQRNRLGVPTPLFEPLRPSQEYSWGRPQLPTRQNRTSTSTASSSLASSSSQRLNGGINQFPPLPPPGEDEESDTLNLQQGSNVGDQNTDDQNAGDQELAGSTNVQNRNTGSTSQSNASLPSSDRMISRGSLAEEQQAAGSPSVANVGPINTIKIPAPEIDWSYAVVERLNPDTLKSSLIPFNLEKLVQGQDPAQNLELQPGDVVTILSQADVHVPQDERTKYIRLEGEFAGAGVYSVGPDETLDQLVRRAGGLTSKAYLYGSSFTRESARIFQQQRLDEYVSSLAISMQRASAVRAASSSGTVVDPNALYEERDTIAQLRKLRATGRVVLEFRPDSMGVDKIPAIPLEDGDVFRIPSRPLTVSVIGAVYGQNVFLYDSKRRVEDYVLLAGKPNAIADSKHAFIIRADGSVFSRQRAKGTWKNSFDATEINPGDAIVIPEKPIQASLIKQVIDYSQIFSQFALGAAAVTVIKQ
jgi:protein involved in polysaccharide export with SLBB domain